MSNDARIAELEAWKVEALLVLAQWDRVGKAVVERFGVEMPLGVSKPEWCQKIILEKK